MYETERIELRISLNWKNK